MYKNRCEDGSLNICGSKLKELRKQMEPKKSQRAFSDKLMLEGIDLNKNAIQKIEQGKRFVTDIELKAIAEIFQVQTDELLDNNK